MVDSHECFLYLCKAGWPLLINSKLEIFFDNTFTNITELNDKLRELLQDENGFRQICTKYNISVQLYDGKYLNSKNLEKISSVILYSRLKMLN